MFATNVLKAVRKSGQNLSHVLVRAKYRNKIATLAKTNGNVPAAAPAQYAERIDKYWDAHYGARINRAWHTAYASVNGIEDERYIPEDLYYLEIEPFLNRQELFKAYVDKNSYDRILTGYAAPATVLKNINGAYYDGGGSRIGAAQARQRLTGKDGVRFIKPSIDSGGGKGVNRIEVRGGSIELAGSAVGFEELERQYRKDFIIQEELEQHAVLSAVYPHSINTLRVLTLRLDGAIHLLSTLARFGNNGMSVDNQATGGLSCSVAPTGRLNGFAINKYGRKFESHPFTGFRFGDAVIPEFERLADHVKDLHHQLPYFDLVSWDMAVAPDASPVLIELNLIGQEINFHQFNNGPLFRHLTEDVLRAVRERRRA